MNTKPRTVNHSSIRRRGISRGLDLLASAPEPGEVSAAGEAKFGTGATPQAPAQLFPAAPDFNAELELADKYPELQSQIL